MMNLYSLHSMIQQIVVVVVAAEAKEKYEMTRYR